MKGFLVSILLICSIVGATQTLTKVDNFGINKGNLKMYTYIPKNLPADKKIPLVLVLHGCTQSATQIANETGWNKLADSLHFIVIYPEQRQINNATKCFNFFIGFKAKKDKGEVASIQQMITYSFNNYTIDSSQIFITGMSAGGGMSNAMLNAYPDIFNAGALIGAPSTLVGVNWAKPDKQPRIAILQGEEDRIVPKSNAEKNLEHWITIHQLNSKNKIVEENYNGYTQLTAQFYDNEKQEIKVVLLMAKEVAHKILINPGDNLQEGGIMDYHTKDIDFHSTFWIADFFGLIQNKN